MHKSFITGINCLKVLTMILFFRLLFAALPLSRREITGAGIDSCNTAQDNKEAPERSNIPENTETENMDRQLNLIDFDENSESDKARRSHARRSNEMNNSPAADL